MEAVSFLEQCLSVVFLLGKHLHSFTIMKVRPFCKIPGALNLPIIGTTHQYFPIIGKYKGIKLHHEHLHKYKEYGPIIRENFTKHDPLFVHLFHPDDFECVFRNESMNPSRHSHVALQVYRQNRKDLYSTGGLLPTNGQEWWRLRKAFQKELSSPKAVAKFLPAVDEVTSEWIGHLKNNIVETKMTNDFLQEFWKVFLEIVGMVLFKHKFNCFQQTKNADDPLLLVQAALTTNHNTVLTDIGYELSKLPNSTAYKKVTDAQEYMEKAAQCLIKNKLSRNNDDSLVSKWSQQSEVDAKDILAMSIDFLLAGIDTSANTSSFLFYYVSTNQKIQDILYKECKKLLPEEKSAVNEEVLINAKYAKAVLKESLRLRPVSIGIGRLLTENITIRNYCIPKATNVLTNNQVACRLEENFHNPFKFIPERWLRHDLLYKQPHPFLLLPFGYGTRACIARRLAEQNMLTILIKIIRNFHIQWEGGELDSVNHLIQKPDTALKFKFTRRIS